MKNFRASVQKYFLYFFIVLVVLNIGVSWCFDLGKTDVISLISASIALSAAVLAVMAIVYQLKSNNEWNQRHTALTGVYDRAAFSKAVGVLKKHIKYTNLEEPMPVRSIHQHICGSSNCTGELLDLTPDGLKITNSIFVMLNYYEYLAVGVKSNVMDEEVIKDMVKGSLLHAYKIFGPYIEHLRGPRHNKKTIYIELEKLAQKWINEDSEGYEQRESTV